MTKTTKLFTTKVIIVIITELWKRDLRRNSVVAFNESFMQRYEMTDESDTAGDAKSKSKGKQPTKDGGKKAVAK